MDLNLLGKRALVNGSSRDIESTIASSLADFGVVVAIGFPFAIDGSLGLIFRSRSRQRL